MTRFSPAPLALLACLAGPLAAQEQTQTEAPETAAAPTAPAAGFDLELNNAATLEGGTCQLTYVAANRSDTDLAQVSYQVGFFDAQGVVRQILVLEFGALPPGKTRIVPFVLPDRSCEDLSRIVVNDVAACQTAGGATSDLCLSGLTTASRTDIEFGI